LLHAQRLSGLSCTVKRLTPHNTQRAKHDDWQAFSAGQARRHKPAHARQAHLLLKLRPRAAQRSHGLQVAAAAAQLARKAGFIFLRAAPQARAGLAALEAEQQLL